MFLFYEHRPDQLSWQKGYLSHFHQAVAPQENVFYPLFHCSLQGLWVEKNCCWNLQRHLWYSFPFVLQLCKCKSTPWWGLAWNDLSTSWCPPHDGQIQCSLNMHQWCRPFPLGLACTRVIQSLAPTVELQRNSGFRHCCSCWVTEGVIILY